MGDHSGPSGLNHSLCFLIQTTTAGADGGMSLIDRAQRNWKLIVTSFETLLTILYCSLGKRGRSQSQLRCGYQFYSSKTTVSTVDSYAADGLYANEFGLASK